MSTSQTELKWYAIYTRPRSEKKVYKLLVEYGYNAYLPLMTTVRQWSDRKKKVQLPLIPSYVFVNEAEKNLKNILSIHGVVNVLKHLKKPAVIKDYEIENLKILLQDTDNFNFVHDVKLKKGDSVIVEKGVFKGLVAECLTVKGKHRVIVRIEALSDIIEVNIPVSHIKRINNI